MSDYRINGWNFSDFIGADGCSAIGAHGPKKSLTLTLADAALGFGVVVNDGVDTDAAGRTRHQVLLGSDLTIGTTLFVAGSHIVPDYSLKNAGIGAVTLIIAQIISGTATAQIVLTASELSPGQQFSQLSVDTANKLGPGQNCFARGTIIETPHGAQPIEQLEDGDEILAIDGRVQQILWISSRRISGLELVLHPQLQPVRIMAGALASGRPGQDLVVSQRHRLLVDDWRAQYLFGEEEILVPARSLLNKNNVQIECPLGGIDYFHLLAEGQEMVCANGLWAETMLPDTATLAMLTPAQRAEVLPLIGSNTETLRAVLPALPHHSAIAVAA